VKFTEAKLAQTFIELLEQKGIPYFPGNTISRNDDEVLVDKDLKTYLLKQYRAEKLTETEPLKIVRKVKTNPASDLYESNQSIMKLISDGFILKREKRSKKDLYIQLINYSGLEKYQNPESHKLETVVAEEIKKYATDNNIYKIVNQLEITGSQKRISDGILYINGLPLVVFEFKSAIREEATIYDAYLQLTTRYKRDIIRNFVFIPDSSKKDEKMYDKHLNWATRKLFGEEEFETDH
jgi:type I restriction enzyme R subunit